MNSKALQRNTVLEDGESFGESGAKEPSSGPPYSPSDEDVSKEQARRPSIAANASQAESGTTADAGVISPPPASTDRAEGEQQQRRQRRRVETVVANRTSPHVNSPSTASVSARSQSPSQYAYPQPHPALINKASQHSLRGSAHSRSPEGRLADAEDESDDDGSASGEDELAIAETAEEYCQERLLPRVLGEFLRSDRIGGGEDLINFRGIPKGRL